jgi:arylsulfatase A-like enzyme
VIRQIISVVAILVSAEFVHAADSNRPPNIVLILADDLGIGNVGCYGSTKIQTPNIDRLATDGMRFTTYYSGATVCAPSRSVLMTGLHTGHTPVRRNGGGHPLREEDVTLPEVLKQRGYATGGFGKWGLGDAGSTGEPEKQGFDHFFGYLHQIHAHFYYTYWLWNCDASGAHQFMIPENEGERQNVYSHDVILAHGMDFIRASKGKPFFCYLPFTLPHVELVVPENSMKAYRGRFPEQPLPDSRPGYIGAQEPYATYAGMVKRLDDSVGKVVALVHELGLDDNTQIVFYYDNRPQAGHWKRIVDFFDSRGPFRGEKTTLYEGGIRVPLIARWPGNIKPGSTSDRICGAQDLMPTFAEVAGTTAPTARDGISLLPTLLMGSQERQHEFMYWEHYTDGKDGGMIRAVRAGDWKIVQRNAKGPFELYDLAHDVAESKNVAVKHPDVMERLTAIAKEQHTPARDDEPATPVKRADYVR